MDGNAVEECASSDGTVIGMERSGKGPPLLLVHGVATDRSLWRRVTPRLSEHFTVFAMDRRGRGLSSKEVGKYSFQAELDDICAAVRHIGAETSIVAHSFGAMLSAEACISLPQVQRVALYEPPIPLPNAPIPDDLVASEMQALLDHGEPEQALITFLTAVTGGDTESVAAMQAQPNWTTRVSFAWTIPRESSSVREYSYNPDRLQELRKPTLLLVGSDSPQRHHIVADTLLEILPNARCNLIPGQKHIAITAAPQEFLGALMGLLRTPG